MAFPEVLQEELGLDAIAGPAPGCKLCHLDDVGGPKTAVKPFGRAVRGAGAVGGSVPSLRSALSALENIGADSDGDSVGDIDELRAGTDPNTPEGDNVTPLDNIPLPQTGCVTAPGSHPDGFAAALSLLLWLGVARRRK